MKSFQIVPMCSTFSLFDLFWSNVSNVKLHPKSLLNKNNNSTTIRKICFSQTINLCWRNSFGQARIKSELQEILQSSLSNNNKIKIAIITYSNFYSVCASSDIFPPVFQSSSFLPACVWIMVVQDLNRSWIIMLLWRI